MIVWLEEKWESNYGRKDHDNACTDRERRKISIWEVTKITNLTNDYYQRALEYAIVLLSNFVF